VRLEFSEREETPVKEENGEVEGDEDKDGTRIVPVDESVTHVLKVGESESREDLEGVFVMPVALSTEETVRLVEAECV